MNRSADLALRVATFAVPLLLFVLACALPVSIDPALEGENHVLTGAMFAACGWSGPLVNSQFAWYANLLLIPTWLFVGLGRSRIAAPFAIVALLLAGSSLFTLLGAEILMNEGGVGSHHIRTLASGYYVWLSLFVVLVGLTLTHAIAGPRPGAPRATLTVR